MVFSSQPRLPNVQLKQWAGFLLTTAPATRPSQTVEGCPLTPALATHSQVTEQKIRRSHLNQKPFNAGQALYSPTIQVTHPGHMTKNRPLASQKKHKTPLSAGQALYSCYSATRSHDKKSSCRISKKTKKNTLSAGQALYSVTRPVNTVEGFLRSQNQKSTSRISKNKTDSVSATSSGQNQKSTSFTSKKNPL